MADSGETQTSQLGLIRIFTSKSTSTSIPVQYRRFNSTSELVAAAKLGTTADLLSLNYGRSLAELGGAGVLKDLSGIWSRNGLEGKLPAAVVAQCRGPTGGYTSVPYLATEVVVVFRRSMFQTGAPEDWPGFRAALVEIKRGLGVVPMAVSSATPGDLSASATAIWLFDLVFVRMFGKDAHGSLAVGGVDLTDDRVRAVLDEIASLFRDGLAANFGGVVGNSRALASGKAACYLAPSFIINGFLPAFNATAYARDVDVMPFPT